jgi:ankyrin repeat protein
LLLNLMGAGGYDNADVMCELLSLGVDPNLADSDGNTALHMAAIYGRFQCARVLIDCRADPRAVNRAGQTPLAIVQQFVCTFSKVRELMLFILAVKKSVSSIIIDH